jgi:hypothetical protein
LDYTIQPIRFYCIGQAGWRLITRANYLENIKCRFQTHKRDRQNE